MLNHEFDGAQDYDFVLRCIEKTKNIKHIQWYYTTGGLTKILRQRTRRVRDMPLRPEKERLRPITNV